MTPHAAIGAGDDAAREAAAQAAALFADAPRSVSFAKLRKRVVRQAADVIARYGLVVARADGRRPRWLVCLSGGKDSYAMLAALIDLRAQGALDVDLLACNLDQGQPGFPKRVLPELLTRLGVAHRIETRDTYSIVQDKTPPGATTCALCSRLRRGHLYRVAREEGCDAIALGHHREDVLETFFMNLFHGGRLAALPPKLLNDEGDVLVARPMLACAEADLGKLSAALNFPIIPCDLCGAQEGLERQAVKAMIADWERMAPGRRDTMLRALMTARPSHLADPALFDFASLAPSGAGREEAT